MGPPALGRQLLHMGSLCLCVRASVFEGRRLGAGGYGWGRVESGLADDKFVPTKKYYTQHISGSNKYAPQHSYAENFKASMWWRRALVRWMRLHFQLKLDFQMEKEETKDLNNS